MCPDCARPIAQCSCGTTRNIVNPDGVVRVFLETKGRRGKGVTVIKGVPLEEVALASLSKELKAACGSGGTSKGGVIEIQGDHRDFVVQKLTLRGWVVKRSGG